jgi:hypothetical protein
MKDFSFIKKLLLSSLLSLSLFGEENDSSKINFGFGLGAEYGLLGFQTSVEVGDNDRIYLSAFPVPTVLFAIGVSSDLRFLKDTNFRTHITYGTLGYFSTSSGAEKCQFDESESDFMCERVGDAIYDLGFSIGLNYYFSKPYEGWHLGLDLTLFQKEYYLDWKESLFSMWKKGEEEENFSFAPNLSLGYKW